MRKISGSMLYDATQCTHRIWMDENADPALKDPTSEFLELLWQRGNTHEKEIVAAMDVVDLSGYDKAEREARTHVAMQQQQPLIYGGRVIDGDLVGEPDLMRYAPGLGYVPGDIKSGKGTEGDEADAKLKPHYAMQVAHYANLLERLGCLKSGHRHGFIIDRHGREHTYDLTAPASSRVLETYFDRYGRLLAEIRQIQTGAKLTRPGLSSTCKQCHWRTACRAELERTQDLTLVQEIGPSKRDALIPIYPGVPALAAAVIDPMARKSPVPGIGVEALMKMRRRARMQVERTLAYTRVPFDFDTSKPYLLFDIESDTLNDSVYLHGFLPVYPTPGGAPPVPGGYAAFFADDPTPEAEKAVFAAAVDYLRRWPKDCRMVYYTSYERTQWRGLQKLYPEVVSADELEGFFNPTFALDVYSDFIKKHTEWPLADLTVKTLATYLGFKWRDTNPSGAASVAWYHEWLAYRDPETKQRILMYNEDDCIAMKVVCEGLLRLPVMEDPF
jgi:predicted RecB family nuclease